MSCRYVCVFLAMLGTTASAGAQPLTIVNITPAAWPSGEEVVLRFRVRGAGELAKLSGTVQVTPDGRPRVGYPLTFQALEKDGAIFQAIVPPSSVDLRYEASIPSIKAGKVPYRLQFEPRPVIVELQVWTSPPKDFPRKPSGEAYETPSFHGDVNALPGSTMRVEILVRNPIRTAIIEVLGRADDSEIVLQKVPLKINDKNQAEGSFVLEPGVDAKKEKREPTGYRIVVTDENGFTNLPAPRRTITISPEEAPRVHLLRDSFGGDGDFDLEGLPVLPGGRIRIPYVCHAPFGMSKATLLYRVLNRIESGVEPDEKPPWVRLPLAEVQPGKGDGPFNPKTGVFANMEYDKQVSFHVVPSANPDQYAGRTLGGGRYFLDTKNGLPDGKGNLLKLKQGDQIEVCIEIHGPQRMPIEATRVGRSETRIFTVVSQQDYMQWMQAVGNEDQRIKMLEMRQQGLFQPK